MSEVADVRVRRVYERVESGDGARVLVDRLWPRGLSKEAARLDAWLKDVAPSSELRKWYGHRAAAYEEFAERYRAELAAEPARGALRELRELAGQGPVTLLTATRELDLSHTTVLVELLHKGV
ncbi:DUF488 domain-containing protein [Streptomyces sclerotialus]|uniref:DUF488 domain-containing protein n=1 Tax=Streptomyces sclerotialus TaxID=1957 RepID=UPI0004C7BDEB